MIYEEQQTQGLNFNLPVSPPSLAQQKMDLLSKNKEAKLNKIAPEPAPMLGSLDDTFNSLYGTGSTEPQSDYIDQIQAGGYKLGRDTAQLGTDIAGWGAEQLGFNETADQLRNIDYRTDEEINQHVGFDPRDHQRDIQNVGESYDALGRAVDQGGVGNILEAGWNLTRDALTATPGLMADSAAIIGSMAIPGVGGPGILAKLGMTAAKTGSKTVPTMLKALDKVVKVNPATLTIGAGMANQQKRAYEEATGKEASWLRIVGSTTANVALMGIEFNIFKGMAKSIPRNIAEDLTIGTAKALASGGVKGLAKNIGINAQRIASVAGAEAGQEYLQTWTQILTEKPGNFGDLIGDKENQKEANIAGILGGTTAGVIRAAPLAVTGTTNLAARAVSGTAKTAANKIADVSARAGYKALTEEDRQSIQDKYEAEDTLHQTFTNQLDTQTETLDKVTTKAGLDAFMNDADNKVGGKIHTASNSIQASLDKLKGKEVTDQMATAIARKAMSANNDATVKSKTILEAARANDATYRVYSNAKQGVKKILKTDIVKDAVKTATKAYKITKDFTGEVVDSTVDTAKNLDTTAARGFMDDVIEGRANNSLKNKDIDKKLKKVINEISDGDLDTMIDIAGNSPYVKKLLVAAKNTRTNARKTLGIVSDSILTILPEKSTIDSLKASANVTKNQAIAIYNELQGVAGQQVIDPKIKKKLDNALKVLERSKDITTKQYNSLERKVKKGYKEQTIVETTKKTANTVIEKTKEYYKKLKPKVKELVEKAKEVAKEEGVSIKNITQALKEEGELTKGETRVMTTRVASELILKEGEVDKLGALSKVFYEQHTDLVNKEIASTDGTLAQEVLDILDPKQSSTKHEEDTILDQEDKVNQNFKTKKIKETEIDAEVDLFAEALKDTLCK